MQSFSFLYAFVLLCSFKCGVAKQYVPARDLNVLVQWMPASSLPPPDELDLKFVLLGIGTQNYTCVGQDESESPRSTGAVAQLYDIGTPLKDGCFTEDMIGYISSLSLYLSQHDAHEQFLRTEGFHLLGHHFFQHEMPVFALDNLKEPYPITYVQKLLETDAPEFCLDVKSVEWLFLKDTQNLSRGDVDTIYRIKTAGGSKPNTCEDQEPSFAVPYAAQYWIFGSKQ